MITLFYSLFIFYIILTAIIDARVSKYKKVNHGLNATAFIIVLLIVCLLAFFNPFKFDDNDKYIEMVQLAFCLLSLRWVVFDLSFNIYSGKNPLYIGNISWMDKHIRGLLHLGLKLLCLFFTTLFSLQWFAR